MHRRSLLAGVAGGLTALPGCTGAPGTGSATPARSPTSEPSPESPAPATETIQVTVGSAVLQYGLVTRASPDSIGTRHPDAPYVAASVRVDGTLPRDAFTLRAGEASVAPTTADRLYRTSWGDERWYGAERRSGLLLFEPPRGAVEGLRLTWPGGEHSLADGVGARLAGPPTLSASVVAPETHAGWGTPPVDIEVTNEGERTGRFVGALNRVGPTVDYTPVARLSQLVAAGETATIRVSEAWGGRPADEYVGDGDADVTYRLDYAGGGDSADIRLVDSEGPESS